MDAGACKEGRTAAAACGPMQEPQRARGGGERGGEG